MLRTIGQHLHAQQVRLWLRSQEDDSLHLRIAIEGEQQIGLERNHPFVRDPQSWHNSRLSQDKHWDERPLWRSGTPTFFINGERYDGPRGVGHFLEALSKQTVGK